MNIKRLNRKSEDFYQVMGPIFGSRLIEKITRDRFYDDPDKTWYVTDEGVASVTDGRIRNFYAAGETPARTLIQAIKLDCAAVRGYVPKGCADAFAAEEFTVRPYTKNFVEVSYEAD